MPPSHSDAPDADGEVGTGLRVRAAAHPGAGGPRGLALVRAVAGGREPGAGRGRSEDRPRAGRRAGRPERVRQEYAAAGDPGHAPAAGGRGAGRREARHAAGAGRGDRLPALQPVRLPHRPGERRLRADARRDQPAPAAVPTAVVAGPAAGVPGAGRRLPGPGRPVRRGRPLPARDERRDAAAGRGGPGVHPRAEGRAAGRAVRRSGRGDPRGVAGHAAGLRRRERRRRPAPAASRRTRS